MLILRQQKHVFFVPNAAPALGVRETEVGMGSAKIAWKTAEHYVYQWQYIMCAWSTWKPLDILRPSDCS